VIGTVLATALTTLVTLGAWWLLLSLNGWTLIAHLSAGVKARSEAEAQPPCIHPGAVLAIGLLPLALLSLLPAMLGACPSALTMAFVMEGLVLASLLPRPTVARYCRLGLSRQLPWHWGPMLWTALAWSLAFGAWSGWQAHDGLTPLLSNANPDLWAYIRRIAASSTEHLYFDGTNACAYSLGSPKKLSSLLMALTVILFPDSVQGITAFQGTLGGTVLLVVFQDWLLQPFSQNRRTSTAKLLAAAWVLTTPVVYWLAVSNYLSQALFLILASIGYREMRRNQLSPRLYPESIRFLLLVSLATATYAFYPAFLPLLILALLLTQLTYGLAIAEPWTQLVRQGSLTLLSLGLTVLLLVCLTTTNQAGLSEVGHSLNPMARHASNFLPLNPWSLLQEKPKPMQIIRDFGWWFHLGLGLMLSLLASIICWRRWRYWHHPDLLAGVVGTAAYGGYLLLFFLLEHTYRLMKLNVTLLYPLVVMGMLPLVLSLRRWTMKRGPSIRLLFTLLVVLHITFHGKVVADLGIRPSGVGLARTIPLPSDPTAPLAIFGCEEATSTHYERLVGLDLALRYPNRQIHVFSPGSTDSFPFGGPLFDKPAPLGALAIHGQTEHDSSDRPYCWYEP